MHSTSRAPELSATLSRDSCWIIASSLAHCRPGYPADGRSLAGEFAPGLRPLHSPRAHHIALLPHSSRALENFDNAPALVLRQRAGLGDADAVTLADVVGLVVRVQALRPLHRLLVAGVPHPVDDGHDDGLVHLDRDCDAFARLAGVEPLLSGFGHHASFAASAASISRSRINVLSRAISRLCFPMSEVLSSWPVARSSRAFHSSCLASDKRSTSVSSVSSRNSV